MMHKHLETEIITGKVLELLKSIYLTNTTQINFSNLIRQNIELLLHYYFWRKIILDGIVMWVDSWYCQYRHDKYPNKQDIDIMLMTVAI